MARAGRALEIRLEGFDELIKKLNAEPPFYRDEWRRGLDDIAIDVQAHAMARAPFETGRLRGSIYRQLDERPMPLWAKVGVTAMAPDGYRYPWALDNSRSIIYRYRSGQFAGRRTLGWFSRLATRIKPVVAKRLEALAQGIAQKWRT